MYMVYTLILVASITAFNAVFQTGLWLNKEIHVLKEKLHKNISLVAFLDAAELVVSVK